jgi:Tfp pilus assembly protein PilO
MQNLSERDRRTLRLGGIAVGAILLLMLVGFPLMERWDKQSARRDELQTRLRNIESGVLDAASATTALAKLEERASLYTSKADLNEQTARLLQQVESLPSYRSILVQRMEAMPMRDEQDYYRSGVSLQLAGSLDDLHRFVTEAEAARPTLRINSFTLAGSQNDPSRVEGTMVIVGYAVVAGGVKEQ